MNKPVRNITEGRFKRRIVNRYPINTQDNTPNRDNKSDQEIKISGLDPNGFYKLHSDFENDSNKYDAEIGFLIVATGKYDVFLGPLIQSIEKYILPNNRKFYNIFSDKNIDLPVDNYEVFNIEHKPFPYPTLYRFHFFNKYINQIIGDQLVYIDADTLITNNIGTEIIYPRVVTQHCGYVNRVGTFENDARSKTCVERSKQKNYYGGGFYSFERSEFYDLMENCISMIDHDSSNGVVPVWHDESALNKYMSEVEPSVVLSPSYHYPEEIEHIYNSWGGKEKYACKILLLNKNHKEIRE
jgi:hypothetical protein